MIQIRDARTARHEDAAQDQANLSAGRARVLLGRVTCRDVPDFVTENSGELRLVLQEGHDPTRDVDVAARQRERVDRRHIDDGEMPG